MRTRENYMETPYQGTPYSRGEANVTQHLAEVAEQYGITSLPTALIRDLVDVRVTSDPVALLKRHNLLPSQRA